MSTVPNENNDIPNDPELQREEQVEIAANILGLSVESARARSSLIEGTASVYVGGNDGAVIVAPDRTHLFASADVSKNEHVKAFWDGQRGNYQRPEEPVEERSHVLPLILIGVLVLAGILIGYLFLSDDDTEPIDTPDQTVTATPSPEETEDDVDVDLVVPEDEATEEEDEEPAPTVTETEEAEAPGDDETLPTEGPPVNGDNEEETFNPEDASVSVPNEFNEGEPTEVSGSGFLPNEEVQFSLTEVNLGSTTADSDGNFEAEITVDGPFETQETDLFIDGAESGIALEEQVQLISADDE